MVLFGTFSKIESKIRKISQLQSAVEIALVDEFHRNLRQMKDLGLDFQEKKSFFYFRSFLRVLQHFEYSADPDFWKCRKISNLL